MSPNPLLSFAGSSLNRTLVRKDDAKPHVEGLVLVCLILFETSFSRGLRKQRALNCAPFLVATLLKEALACPLRGLEQHLGAKARPRPFWMKGDVSKELTFVALRKRTRTAASRQILLVRSYGSLPNRIGYRLT